MIDSPDSIFLLTFSIWTIHLVLKDMGKVLNIYKIKVIFLFRF